MRRASLTLALFALVSALAEGQILSWNLPEHPDPPFATQLRKMPVVIQMTCKGHDRKLFSGKGTGFIVAYVDPRVANGSYFSYLVTNRHVAECWDENRQPTDVQSVALRVNLVGGGAATESLPHARWYFSTDQSADLAVTPLVLSPRVEALAVPLDIFFTKDHFAADNVGEGAKIILSGYFYQIEGEERVHPLIREGILSMIPDEPIQTTTGKRGALYLGDVHIFGGNSGSPVFINATGFREGKKIQLTDDYHFLGVVSGYYYEDSDFTLQIATTVSVKQRANSGVSMIVPADILKDLILNNPDLKMIRDSAVRAAGAVAPVPPPPQ
jgi:hypothetical protein